MEKKCNELQKGVMGVPITILGLQYSDGYIHLLDEFSNEMRYEIVALGNSRDNFTPTKDYVNPKKHTSSGVINGNAINCVLAIKMNSIPTGIWYSSDNEPILFAPYARVLIKKI